jgi:dihydrolipoamide dehydrogenase
MADRYQVAVIGAGPAGYPCAIRAAQNGLSVVCIDDWKNHDGSAALGGTCLNAGCIPSKALLESTELLHRAQTEFAVHGIQTGGITVDLATLQKRRAGIVRVMSGGVTALFKAAGVAVIQGRARLLSGRRIEVTMPDGAMREVTAEHVVLASGSVPAQLASVPFDHERVCDSWDALEFSSIPKSLCVIGAGIVGLELGSVWRRLGAQVVMLEALPNFLAIADQQIAAEAARQFKRQGLDIRLGCQVTGASVQGEAVTVNYQGAGGAQSVSVERVIVAIGRRPNVGELLSADSGVALDERGFIRVDEDCRTPVENVYAIGDCVRGPMLAHKGKEEGLAVADRIAGRYAHVNYEVIPSVIYTAPEIAWVGQTEQQLKASGLPYKSGLFPFSANGRARALEAASGFVKLLAHRETDSILGVHIIGPMAGELIAEATLAMEFEGSAEDLQRTIHAHPTLAEALHEAALAADKRAIDAINR